MLVDLPKWVSVSGKALTMNGDALHECDDHVMDVAHELVVYMYSVCRRPEPAELAWIQQPNQDSKSIIKNKTSSQ